MCSDSSSITLEEASIAASRGLPNRRLKLAGASAGRRDERLGLSRTRSLTRRLAWCTFAPAA
jgi:hypothetical protein